MRTNKDQTRVGRAENEAYTRGCPGVPSTVCLACWLSVLQRIAQCMSHARWLGRQL